MRNNSKLITLVALSTLGACLNAVPEDATNGTGTPRGQAVAAPSTPGSVTPSGSPPTPAPTFESGQPAAFITAPLTVVEEDRFVVSGLQSYYGGGTDRVYAWTSSGAADFCGSTTSSEATPTMCASASAGTATVTLTVNNGVATSAPKSVMIKVVADTLYTTKGGEDDADAGGNGNTISITSNYGVTNESSEDEVGPAQLASGILLVGDEDGDKDIDIWDVCRKSQGYAAPKTTNVVEDWGCDFDYDLDGMGDNFGAPSEEVDGVGQPPQQAGQDCDLRLIPPNYKVIHINKNPIDVNVCVDLGLTGQALVFEPNNLKIMQVRTTQLVNLSGGATNVFIRAPQVVTEQAITISSSGGGTVNLQAVQTPQGDDEFGRDESFLYVNAAVTTGGGAITLKSAGNLVVRTAADLNSVQNDGLGGNVLVEHFATATTLAGGDQGFPNTKFVIGGKIEANSGGGAADTANGGTITLTGKDAVVELRRMRTIQTFGIPAGASAATGGFGGDINITVDSSTAPEQFGFIRVPNATFNAAGGDRGLAVTNSGHGGNIAFYASRSILIGRPGDTRCSGADVQNCLMDTRGGNSKGDDTVSGGDGGTITLQTTLAGADSSVTNLGGSIKTNGGHYSNSSFFHSGGSAGAITLGTVGGQASHKLVWAGDLHANGGDSRPDKSGAAMIPPGDPALITLNADSLGDSSIEVTGGIYSRHGNGVGLGVAATECVGGVILSAISSGPGGSHISVGKAVDTSAGLQTQDDKTYEPVGTSDSDTSNHPGPPGGGHVVIYAFAERDTIVNINEVKTRGAVGEGGGNSCNVQALYSDETGTVLAGRSATFTFTTVDLSGANSTELEAAGDGGDFTVTTMDVAEHFALSLPNGVDLYGGDAVGTQLKAIGSDAGPGATQSHGGRGGDFTIAGGVAHSSITANIGEINTQGGDCGVPGAGGDVTAQFLRHAGRGGDVDINWGARANVTPLIFGTRMLRHTQTGDVLTQGGKGDFTGDCGVRGGRGGDVTLEFDGEFRTDDVNVSFMKITASGGAGKSGSQAPNGSRGGRGGDVDILINCPGTYVFGDIDEIGAASASGAHADAVCDFDMTTVGDDQWGGRGGDFSFTSLANEPSHVEFGNITVKSGSSQVDQVCTTRGVEGGTITFTIPTDLDITAKILNTQAGGSSNGEGYSGQVKHTGPPSYDLVSIECDSWVYKPTRQTNALEDPCIDDNFSCSMGLSDRCSQPNWDMP